MKWIFHEREAQAIYLLTTDRQPAIYALVNKSLVSKTISILTHKEQQKGKCNIRMSPVFCHYMERNPAKIFYYNRGVYMYLVSSWCEERSYTVFLYRNEI